MNIPTKRYSVDTSHGSLVVEDSGSGQLPVLLIHGNSSCRGVFRHQLDSSLAENYRLIALDLPGHGESSDAVNPTKTYTLPGLADAVIELIETNWSSTGCRIWLVAWRPYRYREDVSLSWAVGTDDLRITSCRPTQHGSGISFSTADGSGGKGRAFASRSRRLSCHDLRRFCRAVSS
jgi:hypothetical protein